MIRAVSDGVSVASSFLTIRERRRRAAGRAFLVVVVLIMVLFMALVIVPVVVPVPMVVMFKPTTVVVPVTRKEPLSIVMRRHPSSPRRTVAEYNNLCATCNAFPPDTNNRLPTRTPGLVRGGRTWTT